MMQTEDTAAAYGLPGSLIDPDSGEWASDARHTVAYGARHGGSAERYYTCVYTSSKAAVTNTTHLEPYPTVGSSI